MKLVVVGGSAHSTPNLFTTAPLQNVAGGLDVVLLGRSSDRLAAVARAIHLITESSAIRVTCSTRSEGDDSTIFRGADVVLCQARYGGYEARARDETLPLKYGLCGDEGLGPGGLAAAWRAWPQLREILASVRRDSPNARVLLMTSPVGILTRCAMAAFPDLWLAGICELPWTTLRDACAAVGEDGREATFQYSGVNHLGWFWRVSSSGRDIVAEYGAVRAGRHDFPSGALIQRLAAIPLKYLRMHYEADDVRSEQLKQTRPRAEVLSGLQQHAFEIFRTGDAGAITEVLPNRPSPWYEHAIAPLIAGFGGSPSPIPFFLTVRNESYAAEFGMEDVLEIPHRFVDGALQPLALTGKIPSHLYATLAPFVEYEHAASVAVGRRDRADVAIALRGHPWIHDAEVAALVVQEICG